MPSNPPSPDEIRRADFRVGFRGFDTAEVRTFLEGLAATVKDLTEQRDRLAARLGEFSGRDLKTEFESVGREVASVLESAREAAEAMRARASADAARWRSEAMAEAESVRKDARADSEAMRTDAWTTGSQLLEQVQAEVDRQATAAQRDSLAVLGEAEREAHRLTSGGRREADDLVRNARMEAEKLLAQAKAEHDDIIATAHRQAESAQERTRALEQRRQELMTELESVRNSLSSFESELEHRRQGLGLSDAPDLPRQVVIADERGGDPHVETWEEGHTVRVIRPSTPPAEPESVPEAEVLVENEGDPDAEELADEVARLRAEPEPDEPDEEPATDDAPDEAPPSEGESEGPIADDADGDEVFELFRRLRDPSAPPVEAVPLMEQSPEEPEPVPAEPGAVEEPPSEEGDAFDTRDRLLLPITNSALRAVKRVLTDAQNEALDLIRQSGGQWAPDADRLGSELREELESLVADANEAGREAATELGVGSGPAIEPVADVDSLATELADALTSAVSNAGPGVRERSAAASRVFRGWRTDEAERRVRWLAMASYHGALVSALDAHDRPWRWAVAGRPCPECRRAAEAGSVPPAHRDCACTVEPV